MAADVVVVVVTYDRLALLLRCLDAIEGQTIRVNRVVVVDNAGSDTTRAAIMQRHPRVEIHALSDNLGGAGGFAYGVATVRSQAGQIWLMDDDAAPRPDALARLLTARDRYPGEPVLVASRVVDHGGRPIRMNVPRRRPFASKVARRAAGVAGCVPIRSASFVSVLIDGDACRRHDLPLAGYFIWNDDFEYTSRLLRDAVGLWCPASVVEHATVTGGDPGPRFRYEVRNKVWLLLYSGALAPVEKLLYGGATLRRWIAVIARSNRRTLLLRCLFGGLGEGLLHRPRPTTDVLSRISACSGLRGLDVGHGGEVEAELSAGLEQPQHVPDDTGNVRC
ncbi:MAG TPA: glycosyltransferase [Mycobacteriales bacterium]|nr:glycosyltransferase [Mycobacteriales bacterium]